MTSSNATPERLTHSRGARFIPALAFCLLVALLVGGLQRTMHSYGGGQLWWNVYLQQPEDSIDVLLLGSSHAHSTTSPLNLWTAHGFTSFHLTGSSQGLETSYYVLREALKTQRPKVVVLELYGVQGYQMNDQAMASNYGLMPWGSNKLAGFFAEAKSPLDLQYLVLPLLRDHTRWSTMTRDDVAKLWRGPEDPPPGLGHPVDFHIQDATVRAPEGVLTSEARASSAASLERIATLCDEQDIDLLLYFCPQSLPNQGERMREVRALLREAHPRVRYLDMDEAADEMGLDLSTDFTLADGHLNHLGSLKANAYLGRYLTDTWELEDHRNDPSYAWWHDQAREYDAYVQETAARLGQP